MATALVYSRGTPFPHASGKGLKIAVIDSGVNLRHPHLQAPTQQVNWEGEPEFNGDDLLGHGTAVMAAIQEKAPCAEYFSLRLFGPSLRSSTTKLLRAVDWAIRNRMDVINLSLGTLNPDARAPLQILLDRARQTGTLLVSARSNGVREFMPGVLDGALGIEGDWDIPRDRFLTREGTVLVTSAYPRPLPGMPRARNLNGVSFAVANATGFVALACEGLRERSIESVQNQLAQEELRLA